MFLKNAYSTIGHPYLAQCVCVFVHFFLTKETKEQWQIINKRFKLFIFHLVFHCVWVNETGRLFYIFLHLDAIFSSTRFECDNSMNALNNCNVKQCEIYWSGANNLRTLLLRVIVVEMLSLLPIHIFKRFKYIRNDMASIYERAKINVI